MIKHANRYDEYAYRIATGTLDDSVDFVEEGQWVTYNNEGKLVISDGAKKSFMAIGSKRPGRDQVSGKGIRKIAYLFGHYIVPTDQFDAAGDYSNSMTPLAVGDGGVLKPAGDTDIVVGYSISAPVDGYLRVMIIP